MDKEFAVDLEKTNGEAISFKAYRDSLTKRKGVLVGVGGIKSLVDSSGIRNILADFGRTVIGWPLGADYHLLCADENLLENELGLFLEGDALVVKTGFTSETQTLTEADLGILQFIFERRTMFLTDDNGNTFPAIELDHRAA